MGAEPETHADQVTITLSHDAALVLYGILCRYFFDGNASLTVVDQAQPDGEFWALSDVQVQLERRLVILPQQDVLITEARDRLAKRRNRGDMKR